MILDGHIHIAEGDVNSEGLLSRMKNAGIDGGILISLPPDSFGGEKHTTQERLENLFSWTGDRPQLYPFFWIDPVENDAEEQVEKAVKMGVSGFKVLCSRHYPGDPRALKVYRSIAAAGRPILFHSGILWDGQASSVYNRPAEFEALIDIKGLKFALAHISWPWCDENIAVYGKFEQTNNAKPETTAKMFIDTTPGTPVIYREEALTRLFTVGYHVEDNVFFGTDNETSSYDAKLAAEWINRDSAIFRKLNLSDGLVDKIFSQNLLRFIG